MAKDAPAPRRSRWRTRLGLGVVALVCLVGAGFAVYVWGALHFAYSDGHRSGYVQKFSRKGWICKTWEGELVMATQPAVVPEIFRFTVRDEAVAARINENMGERVSLRYEQHLGLPSRCFGDTDYFVTDVSRVKP